MIKPLAKPFAIEEGMTYVADSERYDLYPEDGVLYVNTIRKGHPVLNTAFLLKCKKNVTLDFKGATLMLHGEFQPFVLEVCENITIRNVVVEYERPNFTEATVEELGDGFLRIRLNPHHPCRVEDGKLIPYCDQWENRNLDRISMFMQSFDSASGEGLGMPLCMIGKTIHPDPDFPFHVDQYVAEQDGDCVILRGPVHECFRKGCVIVLGHGTRNYSSILMLECRNIRLENYRVINGAGMGILPIHTHDIVLDRVEFKYDNRSQGFISNEADAVHSFACSGRFDIIDCVFEGMIDDAMNIHNQFYLLEKIDRNHIILRCKIPGETTHCTIFDVGDTIRVYRGKTMEPEAEYVIREKRILDDEFIDVTLDRNAGPHEPQALVENLTAQCDITIKRCRFGRANSHLRFQSSGIIRVEDCVISLPVLLTGDASYWFESSGVHDMLISDTDFTTPRAQIRMTPEFMPTEKAPFYHWNVRIQNCRFRTDTPVTANYTDKILFSDNTQTDGKPMTLKLINCGDAIADGCTIERKTEKENELRIN